MLKHIWSVLCRKSIIDSETNNISLNDVLERLDVDYQEKNESTDKPFILKIPIEYEIVSMWQRVVENADIKAEVEVVIYSPSKKLLKTFPQKLEVAKNFKRFRSRLRITGIEVNEPGNYIFQINMKEVGKKSFKKVAEIPLEVNIHKIIKAD